MRPASGCSFPPLSCCPLAPLAARCAPADDGDADENGGPHLGEDEGGHTARQPCSSLLDTNVLLAPLHTTVLLAASAFLPQGALPSPTSCLCSSIVLFFSALSDQCVAPLCVSGLLSCVSVAALLCVCGCSPVCLWLSAGLPEPGHRPCRGPPEPPWPVPRAEVLQRRAQAQVARGTPPAPGACATAVAAAQVHAQL